MGGGAGGSHSDDSSEVGGDWGGGGSVRVCREGRGVRCHRIWGYVGRLCMTVWLNWQVKKAATRVVSADLL